VAPREAGLEAACALTTPQRIVDRRSGQDAKLHQLRPEFVTDVHRVRRHVFEIQPDLGDDVIGAAAHAGRRILLILALG
jgi:hypothetical protein